jgi:AmmeMemoRadiSam system protein B
MTLARPPRYAGHSYFADAGRLRASVEAFIEDASQPALSGSLCALVVPCGTHGEIGPLVGHAYKLLLGLPTSALPLLLLAPATAQDGAAAILCDPSLAYATPLGQMPLDAAFLAHLARAGLSLIRQPDDDPHIEVHLPFLQVALGDEPFVPLRVSAGADLAASAWQAVLAQVRLVIAIANLPDAHARDGLLRLDVRAIAQSRRGLFAGRANRPASADRAVLALAVRLAGAKGANRAAMLACDGSRAVLALYRA